MKKIYSALAALAIAGSAFAVSPAQQQIKVTPADEARMQSALAQTLADYQAHPEDALATRASVDANGNISIIIFYKIYELGHYFNGTPGLDEYPYYGIETIIRTQNGKTGEFTNDIACLCGWPTVYSYNSEAFLANQDADEKDLVPVEWDTFWSNAASGKGPKGFYTRKSDTGGTYFVTFGEDNKVESYCIFALNKSTTDGGTANGVAIPASTQLAQGTHIYCTSYENDPDEGCLLGLDVEFTYMNDANFKFTYSGTTMARGFEGINNRIEFAKLYMWNAGVLSGDDDDDMIFAPVYEWGPFQQIYFVAVGEDLEAGVAKQEDGNYTWSLSKLVTNYRASGLPFVRTNTFNRLYGYMMAPTSFDFAKPYGTWTVGKTETKNNRTQITPDAWMMFPIGISGTAWSGTNQAPSYGLGMTAWQYYVTLQPETQIVVGNNTNGFEFKGTDNYGSGFEGSCNSNMKVFRSTTEMNKYNDTKSTGGDVPSLFVGVGSVVNDDMKADVKAANGMITVTAANDAVVNVYAINGALINSTSVKAGMVKNIAVEKGAYVVKVGKNATKVIL